ncbi:MAG: hypothetical protein H0W43_01145 [Chthoniobacterales bacterium]|jgi:hypothetical protein|nr:hypothetical protein [Chthoniobacterales bacterium]
MSSQSTPPLPSHVAQGGPASRNGDSAEAVIFNRLIEWEYPLKEMYSVDPVLFQWSYARLQGLSESRLRKTRVFKGHMLFGLHEVLPQKASNFVECKPDQAVHRPICEHYFDA